MTDIKPTAVGTCQRKDGGELCKYILIGEKYDHEYDYFLGSCLFDFNQIDDDFLSITLFTDQCNYRTARTGEIILKHSSGFRVIHCLDLFNEDYDYR